MDCKHKFSRRNTKKEHERIMDFGRITFTRKFYCLFLLLAHLELMLYFIPFFNPNRSRCAVSISPAVAFSVISIRRRRHVLSDINVNVFNYQPSFIMCFVCSINNRTCHYCMALSIRSFSFYWLTHTHTICTLLSRSSTPSNCLCLMTNSTRNHSF